MFKVIFVPLSDWFGLLYFLFLKQQSISSLSDAWLREAKASLDLALYNTSFQTL